MKVLALDIGGANLKAAHSAGGAWSVPFALWKTPQKLAERLRELAAQTPPFAVLLITTTAELCDCFATKREGVIHVLDAAETLAGGREVRVWTTEGRFVDLAAARRHPLLCAAANWQALASFVASLHSQGTSLLIDTGSTTTDIIPMRDGKEIAAGRTDTDRLCTGELVYLGAARTPLMAIAPTVIFHGLPHHVIAEYFATTADAFVLLGKIPEQPDCTDTADSRPLTRSCAAARVLRMIGADLETYTESDALELAGAFAQITIERLAGAIRQVVQDIPPDRINLSGSGAFIARAAAEIALPHVPIIELSDRIGPEASTAACAYALLQLFAKT